jgi:hypothetical protein
VSHSYSEVSARNQNLQPELVNEYKPRLLARNENVLIIVYQRHSNTNTLILDKSSQDLFLRGFPFGIKVSLYRGRCLLPTFNVSLILKSPSKSKQNPFDQRRRNATHSRDCNRPIHQKDIQRDNDWRIELIHGE